MPTLRSIPVLLAALVGVASAALADGDHDRARAALKAGRVLPLEEIVARASAAFPGEILDVEFEEEHGLPIYEIKLITAGGRVLKLEYDAATGALLKTHGRDRLRHGG